MKQLALLALLGMSQTVFAQRIEGDRSEAEAIKAASQRFSGHVIAARFDSIAACYSEDARIFVGGQNIIEGREAIRRSWVVPDSVPTVHHAILPEEILVRGNEAIDHGYYEGRTRYPDGTEKPWRGKYVVIWRKVDGRWLMYLDIWNRAPLP
jgi:ketosteroid isomerase-like protein